MACLRGRGGECGQCSKQQREDGKETEKAGAGAPGRGVRPRTTWSRELVAERRKSGRRAGKEPRGEPIQAEPDACPCQALSPGELKLRAAIANIAAQRPELEGGGETAIVR